jgi:hypothetical protein
MTIALAFSVRWLSAAKFEKFDFPELADAKSQLSVTESIVDR